MRVRHPRIRIISLLVLTALVAILLKWWFAPTKLFITYPDGVVAREVTIRRTVTGGYEIVSATGKLHDGTMIHLKTPNQEWFKNRESNEISEKECNELLQREMNRIVEQTHGIAEGSIK
ncbi:MAG: hypothetical protein U0930_06035 [Pirellulales bacterium]